MPQASNGAWQYLLRSHRKVWEVMDGLCFPCLAREIERDVEEWKENVPWWMNRCELRLFSTGRSGRHYYQFGLYGHTFLSISGNHNHNDHNHSC